MRTAERPCDAVRMAISGYRPDLLLTEFVLPEMHGVALINEMRTHIPGLPAVILTTGALPLPESFRRRGIWVLAKPCPLDTVWDTITQALEGRPAN